MFQKRQVSKSPVSVSLVSGIIDVCFDNELIVLLWPVVCESKHLVIRSILRFLIGPGARANVDIAHWSYKWTGSRDKAKMDYKMSTYLIRENCVSWVQVKVFSSLTKCYSSSCGRSLVTSPAWLTFHQPTIHQRAQKITCTQYCLLATLLTSNPLCLGGSIAWRALKLAALLWHG